MASKGTELRSDCPVNFGLEMFGDKWSLLIVRDIVFWGKRTYREFLNSDERIATNILATRLSQLVANDILKREPHPTDRRKDIYSLTQKGKELIPLLVEIVAWSGKLMEWQKIAGGGTPEQIRQVKRFASTADKRGIIKEVREAVDRGSYFFAPK